MEYQCSHCSMNTAGQHELNCPCNPLGQVNRASFDLVIDPGARIAALEAKLAKYRPKWQTGRPQAQGKYWVRYHFGNIGWGHPVIEFIQDHRLGSYDSPTTQWSGPIPLPEEE
jgi:hypothetical protein